MFRRILVPSDLTERTVKALDVATALAKGEESHVTVLHVIETIAGADFEEFGSFYRKLEERARRQLADLLARAAGNGTRVNVALLYGNRTEQVLRFVRDHDIDLIVLASHSVDPSQPYRGAGTMSYKLGILAPCAVLLIK